MNAVFYFASNLNGSIVEIVQVILNTFLVHFKIMSKNVAALLYPRNPPQIKLELLDIKKF